MDRTLRDYVFIWIKPCNCIAPYIYNHRACPLIEIACRKEVSVLVFEGKRGEAVKDEEIVTDVKSLNKKKGIESLKMDLIFYNLIFVHERKSRTPSSLACFQERWHWFVAPHHMP